MTGSPLVLVIEDEASLTTLLGYNLESQGFRVAAIGNGADAMGAIVAEKPDLVLLDWMLPGVSELIARIGAVLRRAAPPSAAASPGVGGIIMDLAGHRVSRNGRPIHLGPTEYRLLRHFMEHPGRVLSRDHLLEAVWGGAVHIERRTVDVHVRRLRRALNGDGEDDVIRTVRAAGYAFAA